MALLRFCTLFILLELRHCLPTAHAEKVPEHTCTGYPGVPGTPGHNGLPGRDGREGVAGKDGKDGVAGKDGREGLPGRDGREGVAGKDGKDGVAGQKGERGMMGAQGPPGKFGPVGPSGPKGEKGERGPAGPLPAINLVELQSELQTLKGDFNKSETELQTLKGDFNKSETELQTLKVAFNKSETELQTLKDFVNKIAGVTQFQLTRWVGRKYFVTNKKTGTFDEAVKLCSSVGGVPALPTSLEENQALLGLLSDSGSPYAWLSANDRKTEGRYVDLQEKVIQYSNWRSDRPNGGTRENCVFMYPTGYWGDDPCGNTFLIVCEI